MIQNKCQWLSVKLVEGIVEKSEKGKYFYFYFIQFDKIAKFISPEKIRSIDYQ